MVIRFSPMDPGTWDFRLTSNLERFNGKLGQLQATESADQGFLQRANVHHWRYTESLKAHLWMGDAFHEFATAPSAQFDVYAEARGKQKFTHVRGFVLGSPGEEKRAFASPDQPMPAFFQQLDKRVLEQIHDPLTHLLRNCIDHGLEDPREREQTGKPGQGTITVTVTQAGSNGIEVRVSDDGRGIDTNRVIAGAVRRGIISESESRSLSPLEAVDLLFRSGVSTRETVTQLSGRGLGLAIVKHRDSGRLVDRDCGRCSECVASCPKGALSWPTGK